MAEVAHHTAGAEPFPADLELRFDHRDEVGTRRRAAVNAGSTRRQRDERQVRDDQLDRPADGLRGQRADVGAVVQLDPLVGLQPPHQLPVTDVDGDHLLARRGAAGRR